MDNEQAVAQPGQAKNVDQTSPPAQQMGVLRTMTPEESRRELRQAIQGSKEVLANATTVLSIFPDTLTVDRAKLTITKRSFIRSAEIASIRIEDILNVTATLGPIFGSVKIVSRVLNSERPYRAGPFWRHDAIRIKHVTQGYVIALQRKIDCSSLPVKELAGMLEKLGHDDHISS
jgi:hypothetical protein